MPPEERFVARFAAEPPQEGLPYGRWADTLREHFLAACLHIEDDVGEAGDLVYFPDRTWWGRTYVPVTTRSTAGVDLYGFVSFAPGHGEEEPTEFEARADWTEETAEANPEWQLDLCEEVVGGWRGESGRTAAMTLVWGRPLVGGGMVATAELARLAVDQCALVESRFTLLAPDAYREDYLEIALFDSHGSELARESLYDDDGEEEGDEA
jgi:hypothetical protein